MNRRFYVNVIIALALTVSVAFFIHFKAPSWAQRSNEAYVDEVEHIEGLYASFNSTSLASCVDEEACAWAVFSKLVTRPGETEKTAAIKKWKGPLKIKVLGDENGAITDGLESAIREILPYFPYDITLDSQDFNYVVIVSENFKKDAIETHGDFFEDLYNGYVVDYFENNPYFPNSLYLTLPLINKEGEIFSTVLFVKAGQTSKRDILSYFFKSLGLTAYFYFQQFTEEVTPEEYENFLMFVLMLFYHEDIRAGMSLSQAKLKFKHVYTETLAIFKQQ